MRRLRIWPWSVINELRANYADAVNALADGAKRLAQSYAAIARLVSENQQMHVDLKQYRDITPATVTGWCRACLAARHEDCGPLPDGVLCSCPCVMEEQTRGWWFTFPADAVHPINGRCVGANVVVIHGTYNAASAEMSARFGEFGWRWQYSSATDAGVERFALTELTGDEALGIKAAPLGAEARP